jgi:hypothetical protein
MAAGKPDARRFLDISRFGPEIPAFGDSCALKHLFDIINNFLKMDSAESKNFPVFSRLTGICR